VEDDEENTNHCRRSQGYCSPWINSARQNSQSALNGRKVEDIEDIQKT
jgi:hypothetical protein